MPREERDRARRGPLRRDHPEGLVQDGRDHQDVDGSQEGIRFHESQELHVGAPERAGEVLPVSRVVRFASDREPTLVGRQRIEGLGRELQPLGRKEPP